MSRPDQSAELKFVVTNTLIVRDSISPGDIKKRQNAFGYGMPYPRVIPHSDGAGRVDQLGAGVPSEWMGRSVVLRSPVLSSIWHGRRIYRGAGGSSWAATRRRLDGTRRLPWYTGHHGAPSRSCCRCREWTHCLGARSGGFSGPLRCSVGTFRGSPSDRNCEVDIG